MTGKRRRFDLGIAALAVGVVSLTLATAATAGMPTATATGPAVLTRTVSTSTETITFAGTIDAGGETLLYGAWGLIKDAAAADALAFQSDADTSAQAAANRELLRDQASVGDVGDIQDLIDDLVSDMTDDIDNFKTMP